MDKAQYLKAAEQLRGAVGGEFTFNHKVPSIPGTHFINFKKR